MENLKNILKGGIIGISNLIPGISGGTMAVILSIYDKLIKSINGLRTNPKENIKFLGTIFLGAGLGIFLFSGLLNYLLNPTNGFFEITQFLFIGLIVGSIPVVFNNAKKTNIKKGNYIFTIVACLIVVIMSINNDSTNSNIVETTLSMNLAIKLFLGGFMAAVAMVLPGISGSFIFLLMGVYSTIVTAISSLNIKLLIFVALGALIGLLVMTRIVEKLLEDHPQITHLTILGLMLGSALGIIPIVPKDTFIITGILITFAIGFIGARKLGNS